MEDLRITADLFNNFSKSVVNQQTPIPGCFTYDLIRHNHLMHKIPNDVKTFSILNPYFKLSEKQFDPIKRETLIKEIDVLEKDEEFIYIPSTFVEPIKELIVRHGLFVNVIDIECELETNDFDIAEKWIEFFREDQIPYLNEIISKDRGIAQLYTGFGKTEFIIALAESYTGKGNVLITAPFNTIKDEILMRADKQEMDVDTWFNINNKINAINPVGLRNSNKVKNPKVIEWLNNVDLIIMDESDNINASFRDLFDHYLINFKYFYGFSATPDKYEGKLLKTENLMQFGWAQYQLLKYIGPTISYCKSTRPINFNILQNNYDTKQLPRHLVNLLYNKSLINVIQSNAFLTEDLPHMLTNKNDILFINVSSFKHAEMFYDKIASLGYVPVKWRRGYLKTINPDINTYRKLQDACIAGEKIDVIISTVVGTKGINIPRITDVYLYTGTKYTTVMQPIGRAFRGTHTPTVWLSHENTNRNEFFNNCSFRRISIIKKSYKCEKLNYVKL